MARTVFGSEIHFRLLGHRLAYVSGRLEKGAYVPWVADDDGWWRSRSLGISFQPTQPFMTIRDREGRQLSLPHQAFEREYTREHVEHELAEAQRRIAEMEAQLRALRGDGTSGALGDLSPS